MPLILRKEDSMKEILNIKNLKIYFASSKGPIKSLNGVDLTLKEGQT